MKTSYAIGLVIAAVLITASIQESRISALRKSIRDIQLAETPAIPKTTIPASSSPDDTQTAPERTRSRTDTAPAARPKKADSDDESIANTARKMWDNPAGKAMMTQHVKMAVGMMYQGFIDQLNLTKEEGDYFKNLLGKEMGDQQELGMKMLGASEEERETLGKELKKLTEANDAEIKKFLNNEDDVKAFAEYKNRLPEHQQLDGIRAAMSNESAPLNAETEAKLVDAMYRARTEAKAPDFSGPDGLKKMAEGNIVETYEKSWEATQELLRTETTKILNPSQLTAFEAYQKQAKEMQLLGLKMAEKMMPNLSKDTPEAPAKK